MPKRTTRKGYRVISRPRGMWQAWAWDPAAKKYTKRSFPDKAAATSWAKATSADYERGVASSAGAPIDALIAKFMREKENPTDGARPVTPLYAQNTRRWLERLRDEARVVDLKDEKAADKAREWVRALKTRANGRLTHRPAGPKSRRDCIATLRAFGEWARRRRSLRLPHNPFDELDLPKVDVVEREIYPLDDLRKMLSANNANDPAFMVAALAVYGGMRAGDIRALRWEWIDFERQWIALPAELTKERRIRLPRIMPELRDVLESIRMESGPVVPVVWGANASARGAALIRSLLARHGIDRTGRVLHDLRHCCAALMCASGALDRDVMDQLGHADRHMLDHYRACGKFYRHSVEREGWPPGQICLRNPPKKAAASA